MSELKSVPAPTALKELLNASKLLLQSYQEELNSRFQVANREMMAILNLNSHDGWELDIETMTYIKREKEPTPDDTSIS